MSKQTYSIADDCFLRVKVDGKFIHGETEFSIFDDGTLEVVALSLLDNEYAPNAIDPCKIEFVPNKKYSIQFYEDEAVGDTHEFSYTGQTTGMVDEFTAYRFKFQPIP